MRGRSKPCSACYRWLIRGARLGTRVRASDRRRVVGSHARDCAGAVGASRCQISRRLRRRDTSGVRQRRISATTYRRPADGWNTSPAASRWTPRIPARPRRPIPQPCSRSNGGMPRPSQVGRLACGGPTGEAGRLASVRPIGEPDVSRSGLGERNPTSRVVVRSRFGIDDVVDLDLAGHCALAFGNVPGTGYGNAPAASTSDHHEPQAPTQLRYGLQRMTSGL